MKFLVTKDLAHSKLLSYLMGSVVVSIFIFLVLDILLHSYLIGSDISSIKTTLYGDVESFEEPIIIDSLLLQIHIDFFMTLFSLLILSSIYIRLYSKALIIKAVVHSLFMLGLLAPIFLIMAYLYSVAFICLWIVSFVLWHFMALILSLMILKRLYFR